MRRRWFLVQGLGLTPLTGLLYACGDEGQWPPGMAAIKWDRDPCTRCKMIISDRRFACEIRGGPKDTVFKFDDVGCAATWLAEKLKEYPWMADGATRLWVADFEGGGQRWLDAPVAHFVKGPSSPMGYNYAAYAAPREGSLDFHAMGQKTSATWPANCMQRPASVASSAS